MTAKYDRENLKFQYPENWSLDEEPPVGLPRTISVTAKSGAFWSAIVYRKEEMPLQDLLRQYEDALLAEYDDAEQDDVEIELPNEKLSATEFCFYCLDFLVRSRLIALEIGDHHVIVTWQAEDREFDDKEPVFLAMTFSLMHQTASA